MKSKVKKDKKVIDNFKNKIKFKIDYKSILKIGIMLLFVGIVFNALEMRASADGLLDYGQGENPFNKIESGFGQFVQDKYRNNYDLDSGKIGTFDVVDKSLNALANGFFNIMLIIAWLGINVFKLCFSADIAGEFASLLESVGTSIRKGVFDKFFMLMFVVSLISVLIYFAKRNYAAILSQIVAVCLLVVMSIAISSDGARQFVVSTTGISREIGMTLVSSLSGEDDTGMASNDMMGTMWGNLVHKPWVMLEFGGAVSVDEKKEAETIAKSKAILSLAPKSDERKDLAEKEIVNISFTSRLASTFILCLITIVKLMIIIAMGVIQIFMQIMGVGIILIAPIFLLMAIVPFFGGTGLLKWLGEKYLSVQISIIVLNFVIGLLILMDDVILKFFTKIGGSFTVALLIQCVCWILIVVFRKELVSNFNKLQRKINGSVGAGRMLSKVLNKETQLANKVVDPVKNKAVNFKNYAVEKGQYASKYATGKATVGASKLMASGIDKVAAKWNEGNAVNKQESESTVNSSADTEKEKMATIDLAAVRIKKENSNIKEDINKEQVKMDNIQNKETGKEEVNEKLKEMRNEGVEVINISNENNRENNVGPERAVDNEEKLTEDNVKENNTKEEANNKLRAMRNEGIEGVNIENTDSSKENVEPKNKIIQENNIKEDANEKLNEKRNEDIETVNLTSENSRKNNIGYEKEEVKEEKLTEDNVQESNNKEEANNKLKSMRDEGIEGVNIENIDSSKENIEPKNKIVQEINNKEEANNKIRAMRNEEVEGVNIDSKDNIEQENNRKETLIKENNVEPKKVNIEENINNKNREIKSKVIPFNVARARKGKSQVDVDKLRENLRKSLESEGNGGIRVKQTNKKIIDRGKSISNKNTKKKEVIKPPNRVEKLKNILGVSNNQIKNREVKLDKSLKQIKNIPKNKKK